MDLTEHLRAYALKLNKAHKLWQLTQKHKVNLTALAMFAKGNQKNLTIRTAEPLMRKMILDDEFDLDEWLKGEDDDEKS